MRLPSRPVRIAVITVVIFLAVLAFRLGLFTNYLGASR